MDLIAIRRGLLTNLSESPSEQVGIFTKGYEATLKPGSTTEFVIPHNLGIMPRLCIIEMDRSMAQATNYCINAVVDFDVEGWEDKTGSVGYIYCYNGTDTSGVLLLPDMKVSASETSITLIPFYSNSRSPWDTNANYHVRVWG